MKNSDIKPKKGSTKNRKRKGRGNAAGQGGECGRGHKGQKSRAGYSARFGFEGGQMPLYKRVPKKKGFKNLFKVPFAPINLSDIEEKFQDNETVDKETLVKMGLVRKKDHVKVQGNGTLTKKVVIKVEAASKSAIDKIEKAGAKIEITAG